MRPIVRTNATKVVSSIASMATVCVVVAGAPAFANENLTESPTSTPPAAPCASTVPKVKKKYWSKVPARTKQIVVVEGRSMKSYNSKLIRWEKRGRCWVKLSTHSTYNGYKGWAIVPWTGGMRSPIGTYRLTDAGGRLRNPGTKMPYHYGPQAYGAGGYAMNRSKLQIFDYVVAINYNRKAGTTPRANKVRSRKKASGYWFHVRRAFPTRGCVSMSRTNMKTLTRWLDPTKKPVTIQGPRSTIYS